MEQTKDVVTQIRTHYDSFSKSHRRLADFILENLHEVAFLSINELSQRTGISPATITRFARRLDFQGYPDLQRGLYEHQKQWAPFGQLKSLLRRETPAEDAGPDSLQWTIQNNIGLLEALYTPQLRDSFALDENEFGYELRLRAALGEIWLGLLALPRPEARPGAAVFDEKCKAMLAFVHEHYAEPLRIEQIAAAGFCSQREAFRTFQQCLHVTPLNYLQSYRLQMAADRLVHSGQQITAIAVDCGFASLSYFGKVFRQKFGCTPAQFRSKWQDITNTGR